MLKKLFAALLCFLGITSSFSQENSLLWSVSGNGLKQTSYLYGTVHLICEDDFEIKEKVNTAFDQCDQLFLEIDMDDSKEMGAMIASATGEQPLTEILSIEQQQKLNEKLQADLGLTIEAVNNYSLTTISSLFMMNGMDCKMVKSYEQEFIAMAQAKGIEIEGLEKVAFQLECLNNSMSNNKIFETIFDEDLDGFLDSLISLYNAEDLTAMETMFLGGEYMSENEREWLLETRNDNWVKRMPKIMKKNPTFFAVGTAHLLGEDGLIELLRAQGYTVTPIFQ